MTCFHLSIITPQGVFLDENVEELYIKTNFGYQGILANHDTLVTSVEIAPGFIIKNKQKTFYAFFGGILNIKKDGVVLILNNIENADSIDRERAEKSHQRAVERLNQKDNKLDLKRAQASLQRSLARIQAVKKDFI